MKNAPQMYNTPTRLNHGISLVVLDQVAEAVKLFASTDVVLQILKSDRSFDLQKNAIR